MARLSLIALPLLAIAACSTEASLPIDAGFGASPTLPAPDPQTIPVMQVAEGTGWPAGDMPVSADGLKVNAFATGLDHPRWLYVLPNGDVLVAESNAPAKDSGFSITNLVMKNMMEKAGAGVPSADRITLLRDTDGNGVADIQIPFLEGLYSPFGMALVGDTFYVANADGIVGFEYDAETTSVNPDGKTLTDLPAGRNHHWTKNIIASEDGTKLYATVGSNSNIGENGMDEEEGRAAIWEVDIATGEKRLFATGLRNPNGMDWNPVSGELWTAVNERDMLGNNLVPDYMTSVSDGAFYGWPWSYYGQNVDERVKPKNPEMVEKAIAPDYALGSHTASLGLEFSYEGELGSEFATGAFVGQHGSWNRKPPSGYKVIFVPFNGGEPSGQPIDVLSGFLVKDKAYGRPVDVKIAADDALLVSDDVGNTIWRVTAD